MADASHNMAKQAHQTGAAAGAGCVKPGALAWYADMPGLSSMSGPQVSLKKISRELGRLSSCPACPVGHSECPVYFRPDISLDFNLCMDWPAIRVSKADTGLVQTKSEF